MKMFYVVYMVRYGTQHRLEIMNKAFPSYALAEAAAKEVNPITKPTILESTDTGPYATPPVPFNTVDREPNIFTTVE